jgi:hypothetical protein
MGEEGWKVYSLFRLLLGMSDELVRQGVYFDPHEGPNLLSSFFSSLDLLYMLK